MKRMAEQKLIEQTSFSLPQELLREARRVAKKEGFTENQLLTEALQRYLQERKWRALQRYGARRAKQLGLSASSVERLISEYRKQSA